MSTAPNSPDDVDDPQGAPVKPTAASAGTPAARTAGAGAKRPGAKKASPRSRTATTSTGSASARAGKAATAQPVDEEGPEAKPSARTTSATGKTASGKTASGKTAAGKSPTAKSATAKTATAKTATAKTATGKPAAGKPAAGETATAKTATGKTAVKPEPAKRPGSASARAASKATPRSRAAEAEVDDDNTITAPRRPAARKTAAGTAKSSSASSSSRTTRQPAKKTAPRSSAARSAPDAAAGGGGPEAVDSVASSEDAVITGVGSDRGTTDVTNEAAETADGAAATETVDAPSGEPSPGGDAVTSVIDAPADADAVASGGTRSLADALTDAAEADDGPDPDVFTADLPGDAHGEDAQGEDAQDEGAEHVAPARDGAKTAPEVDAVSEEDPAPTDGDADLNELLGLDTDTDTDAGSEKDGDVASDATAPGSTADEAAHDASPASAHPEAHLLAPLVGASPRSRPAAVTESAEPVDPASAVLVARGLVKDFGGTHAVDEIDLTVPTGSFYGIVGPNGAGKTTTLSMISGLLRPDRGSITVAGIDARQRARAAKKLIGVLPDRFRTFDRLTGRQLLHYYGLLRGLKPGVVDKRTADLARAFDLTDALGRAVSDYSAGMTKKVMLAGAMIHSPRLLVLDEPFEAVDPVSAAVILEILSQYVAGGGTVILSSHTMELVERVCSRVAVVVSGQVLAEGTVEEVRGDLTLEQRFVELSGGLTEVEGLEWLHTFSD
ncbi:ATP-binding cassette domain-containing protein [Microbacterium nymphoidis]|uniref:ATP-binding cassette domain-containing protein n=1 Tax=Microbacterium nymphoidis TaxID=2898586 RepID=UPI0027E18A7C|nr:ATP-binding cassette domain-containing protein [Microbacterium nymphoidis]